MEAAASSLLARGRLIAGVRNVTGDLMREIPSIPRSTERQPVQRARQQITKTHRYCANPRFNRTGLAPSVARGVGCADPELGFIGADDAIAMAPGRPQRYLSTISSSSGADSLLSARGAGTALYR